MSELKGQAQRGERTRHAIVDAALDVFALRGFRAGALTEIAEKVGLSSAGILYHFGSKEALLVAVIAERDRRAGGLLVDLHGDEGLASLHSLVRIAELCEREPGLAALHTVLQVENLEPGAPAYDYFQGRARFVREAVESFLASAQEAGDVHPSVDIPAKSRELIAFLEGAAVVWLLDPTTSLVALYRTFLTTYTHSLAHPPPVP